MLAVCTAAQDGHAATSRLFEFAELPNMAPNMPPTWPARTDATVSTYFNDRFNGQKTASFDDRFDGQKTSLIRDLLASPASRALLRRSPPPPRLPTEPPLTTASLPLHREHRQTIIPAGKPIVGIASMYDPTNPNDLDAGNEELASGERYDVNGWTAAIRTDLRKKFGGVRFGRNYRPSYALVQANDKRLIVKINDVGPLRRGRIIDLNRRAMRYFDPTLQLGLIGNVKVTPLVERNWTLGPIIDSPPVSIASRSLP